MKHNAVHAYTFIIMIIFIFKLTVLFIYNLKLEIALAFPGSSGLKQSGE